MRQEARKRHLLQCYGLNTFGGAFFIKLIITTYRLKNGNNYLRSYCSCGTLGGRRSDNGNQQIAGEIASKQHNRGGKTRS